MKMKAAVVFSLLLMSASLVADRALTLSEIEPVLEQLTQTPVSTWIEQGTIEAIHEEYHAPLVTDEQQILQKIELAQQEYSQKTNKAELGAEMQDMKMKAIPFNVRYQVSNEYRMTTKVLIRYDAPKYYCQIDVLSRKDSIRPPLDESFMYEFFNLDWNATRITSWDGSKFIMYNNPSNMPQLRKLPPISCP